MKWLSKSVMFCSKTSYSAEEMEWNWINSVQEIECGVFCYEKCFERSSNSFEIDSKGFEAYKKVRTTTEVKNAHNSFWTFNNWPRR